MGDAQQNPGVTGQEGPARHPDRLPDSGTNALVTPALVMVAAIAPLALIAGGLVLLFGGRRGMQIIGTSLGVLLLLGSVTALIK